MQQATKPRISLKEYLVSLKTDKKRRKKFWSLFQLTIGCLIAFPLEIADIVFMFHHPDISHYTNDFTSQNQILLYNKLESEFAFQWVSFILTTFVVIYCGWGFLKNAFFEMFKWKRMGMSTLITLSVLVAYFFSFYPLIQNTVSLAILHGGHMAKNDSFVKLGMLSSFFPTAATVIVIAAIGGYIQTTLKLKANDDLTALTALQVSEAYVKNGAEIVKTPVKKLQIGDVVVVYKNTLIPIDGKLLSSSTLVNEANVTGESRPVLKNVGDRVIGSTTNLGETCEIEVTTLAKDSVIAGIIKSVKNIQSQKPKYQKVADKIAFWFVPIIVTLALLAFFLHAFVPDFNENLANYTYVMDDHKVLQGAHKYISSVYAGVAVLVVACPCALGLAVPLALVITTSRTAKNGIMINHAEAYESVKKIDVIAFDKTGTLTKGEFEVQDYVADDRELHLLYALEQRSLHPMAKSYQNFYENKFGIQADLIPSLNVQEIAGMGMEAIDDVTGRIYRATSLKYARNNNFAFNKSMMEFLNHYDRDDQFVSFICLTADQEVLGIVAMSDDLNANAAETIKVLQAEGVKVVIISGDAKNATKAIAERLNLDGWYGEVTPEQKAEIIAELQQNNTKTVAFVGDGINDIVAMKQADLSISFSKDNAVANSITDISILNKDVYSVYKAIRIIKGTRKNIFWNLAWACIYNAIFIPITIMGYVPPYIAAFAMMFSEIVIVTTTIIFKGMKIKIIPKKIWERVLTIADREKLDKYL